MKNSIENLEQGLEVDVHEVSVIGDVVRTLPVLPLKNVIAMPKSIMPVVVGREISTRAVEHSLQVGREIFVTAQRTAEIENPTAADLFTHGTRAVVLRVAQAPNGTMKILIEGIARAVVQEMRYDKGYFVADVVDLKPEPVKDEAEAKALWRNLHALFKRYVKLNDKMSSDVLDIFKGLEDLDYLTDTIAVQVHLEFADRQEILAQTDVRERAIKLSAHLKNEIEVLEAEKNIRKRVQNQVEKHQKDYYLNEQMRAIQRELGRDDHQIEIDLIRKKAKECGMTKEAFEKVESECRRLEQMQPTSPEAAVSRNYVEWLVSVPWKKKTRDRVSFTEAIKILDGSHEGMNKAKERIIEFIAAKKFAGDKLERTPIICLAGAPGVGKTSLGRSIAEALGREFVRISLGGMRDEAEIRGHRRTYIGAMPGKVVQMMRKAGVINPVILLDEVDKMSMDFRGDPASALLEVLDPEQNKNFSDYFLEAEYDLSKVLFILTANVVDMIPGPLLDRMDVVYLSGYTDNEKMQIAKKFLMPRLLKEYALEEAQIDISDHILGKLLSDYTKEAGVRQLERTIARILRKCIKNLLEDKKLKKVVVTDDLLEVWLGVAKYRKEAYKHSKGGVGLVTGLAWTEVGGDVLEIEVTLLKGKGALTLTGQLGEVMQESVQAALSYIRSRAKELGVKPDFYASSDIHIHLPEGAIPKDGPSAGIAMALALTSALTQIPVAKDVAMTGEITLRGRILPVGGLKEKLLAAIRFGFKKVIVPKENELDIKEFLSELEGKLELIYADNMDTVLEHGLDESPFKKALKKDAAAAKKAVAKKKVASKSSDAKALADKKPATKSAEKKKPAPKPVSRKKSK